MHRLIAAAWAMVLIVGCSGGPDDAPADLGQAATEEPVAVETSGAAGKTPAETGRAVAEEPAAVEASGSAGDAVVAQRERDVAAPVLDGSDEMLLDEDDEAAGGSALAEAGVFADTWRVGGRYDRTVPGDPDAPVLIQVYGDFRFGGNFWDAAEIWVEVVATGIARYEFVHFPVFNAASLFAANAAECAADQGRFWQFHDYLFGYSGISSYYEPEGAAELAGELGMDVRVFADCIDRKPHDGRIRERLAAARVDGVLGPLTIHVDGEEVESEAEAVIAAVWEAAQRPRRDAAARGAGAGE